MRCRSMERIVQDDPGTPNVKETEPPLAESWNKGTLAVQLAFCFRMLQASTRAAARAHKAKGSIDDEVGVHLR